MLILHFLLILVTVIHFIAAESGVSEGGVLCIRYAGWRLISFEGLPQREQKRKTPTSLSCYRSRTGSLLPGLDSNHDLSHTTYAAFYNASLGCMA